MTNIRIYSAYILSFKLRNLTQRSRSGTGNDPERTLASPNSFQIFRCFDFCSIFEPGLGRCASAESDALTDPAWEAARAPNGRKRTKAAACPQIRLDKLDTSRLD
jgi:hypothetical protein